MGKYTTVAIKVPDVNRSFTQGSYKYSDPAVAKANKAVLDKIYADLGTFITRWVIEFEVDDFFNIT